MEQGGGGWKMVQPRGPGQGPEAKWEEEQEPKLEDQEQ